MFDGPGDILLALGDISIRVLYPRCVHLLHWESASSSHSSSPFLHLNLSVASAEELAADLHCSFFGGWSGRLRATVVFIMYFS